MTPRPLPHSRLDQLIPPLVASQALIALVPATADVAWAARVAWDVARIAALGGRRVALIDLWFDGPGLEQAAALPAGPGVIEAFARGESLDDLAHERLGVFFIPRGESADRPAHDVLESPRWDKLHAGFRAEDALLLLYLSAASLGRLSTVPDGVLLLAPEGAEPAAVGLREGPPVLGVVRERWTPPINVAPVLDRPSGARPMRVLRPVAVGLALAAVTGGGWTLVALARESRRPHHAEPARDTVPAAPAATVPAAPARIVALRAPRGDSAAWTIQLAAYGTLDKAVAHATRLADDGITAFVTPIAVDRDAAGTVWYRVLAGAYGTRAAALSARNGWWRHGTAPRGQGDVLRAPYSLSLGPVADSARLGSLGIPVVRWSRGNVLLVGAFETPEQATTTAAQIARAGLSATLVTRTGTTP